MEPLQHKAPPNSMRPSQLAWLPMFRRGIDTVGNPHRTQISQFELFELILLLKLDKQFSIEQFEPTVSQSTVPFPPLTNVSLDSAKNWITVTDGCIHHRVDLLQAAQSESVALK